MSEQDQPRPGQPRRDLPADLPAGTEVAGYLVEEQIGFGGMAVIYRARDARLERDVALKILAPRFAQDDAFQRRFIRESRAAAAVDHPHIIPIFSAGEAGGVLYIAMRYVPGGDVRTLMAAEDTGRVCFGLDLDPLHLDTAIRRWQNATGREAISLDSGEPFNGIRQRLLAGPMGPAHGS